MPSTNGYKTFNFSFIVPENKTDDMEKAVASHGEWMRQTHSIYTRADHNYGFLGTLVDYYWAKSPELNNPLDPESGTTGNILYSLNEVYTRPEGTDAHMEAAPSWESFEAFLALTGEFQSQMIMSGDVIQSMFADEE